MRAKELGMTQTIINAILELLPIETIIVTILTMILDYLLGKTKIIKANSLLELGESGVKGAAKKAKKIMWRPPQNPRY